MEKFRPKPDQPQSPRNTGEGSLGLPSNAKKELQPRMESPEGRHDDDFLSPEEKITLRQVRQYMRSAELPMDEQGDEKLLTRIRAKISDQDIDETMKEWLEKGEASRTRNEPQKRE